MPKISDVCSRKLMRSRIGGDPGVAGPTARSPTSRMSERSISEPSVNSVARFLERRPQQIDRRQRDGEKYAGYGRDPPCVDQILAGIGDDAAKARRRRLDAQSQKAEDRLENHHARDVEYRDECNRRQDIRGGEQQQNTPIACTQNTQAPDILLAPLG